VSEAPPEFLEIFRDEANERLDRIVDTLLALERGEDHPDAIGLLLRETHTLKGAAGMIGLDEARTIAHEMEDRLSGARDTGRLPAELTEPLLRAADALRSLVTGSSPGPPAAAKPQFETSTAATAATAPSNGEGRAIRVPSEKIDALLQLVDESVHHRRRLEHSLEGTPARDSEQVADELTQGARLGDDLKDAAIGMRTLPLDSITGALPRAVRDLAISEGKEVELIVSGGDTELDRVILEGLSDPLVHLLNNAVAHGIEPAEERERLGKPRTARLELRAEQRGRLIELTVADDGRGVPRSVLDSAARTGSLAEVLAQPGFSTADGVTELAGRGVGLDAVKSHVEAFGGSLEVRSEPGRGTEVVLLLPMALALLEVLLVERGGGVYGVPLASVEEVIAVTDRLALGGTPAIEVRGKSLPLADLAQLLGGEASPVRESAPAVVMSAGGRRLAITCDAMIGKEEVVVKSLAPLLASLDGYLGAAVLGDGRIALLLDPATLVRVSGERAQVAMPARAAHVPKVLVVEDSYTVRELQRSILEAAGYSVDTARSGREALQRVTADDGINLVMSDVEMPEMDGIQLTESIRAMPERASLPVVIVTSRDAQADRERGIEAGADAYMVKREFDQRKLLGTIERLIGS
jgi:two-component system chemotaxis sensor kinase CheA